MAIPALQHAIAQAGGWLPFDRYMALALYAPGWGYYASGARQFGHWPGGGSDFVTAPELSPLFGRTLARQVAEALRATGTDEVWEFGAGSGALAAQVLQGLAECGLTPRQYRIVEVSGALRERQRQTLAAHGDRVQWLDRLPERIDGVVLGNEVLDAMPVQLLARVGGVWHERGVVCSGDRLAWADRPTDLRPPLDIPGAHDHVTEIHPQASAFVRTVASQLGRAVAFFIDYGFPEAEYHHPQRHMGTLMCHQGHRADGNALDQPGEKDITAHVDFTAMALAAQDTGQRVLGYTSQGRFLLNAGLTDLAQDLPWAERARVLQLVNEHEMGELFKVLAFCPEGLAPGWVPSGFAQGDRTHTL